MARLLPLILLVSLASCAGERDRQGGVDSPSADTFDQTEVDASGVSPPDDVSEPTRQAFQLSTDDPVYVALVLDCVYGTNDARSCEQLEAAGVPADDSYGLGDAMAAMPADALRIDCLGGEALACGELNARVAAAVDTGDGREDLLCLFSEAVGTGAGGSDLDFFHLAALVDSDAPAPAPAAVVDGIASLSTDRADSDTVAVVTAYFDPLCIAAEETAE